MFQSSPAIAGGRDSVPHPHPPTASGFNPRPPLLAGATIQRHCYWRGFLMFQSSPAIAGGRDPARRTLVHINRQVSILARHCWRARQFADKYFIPHNFPGRLRDPRSELVEAAKNYNRSVPDILIFHRVAICAKLPEMRRRLRFAQFHKISGASKSMARKMPYSRISQPRVSGIR